MFFAPKVHFVIRLCPCFPGGEVETAYGVSKHKGRTKWGRGCWLQRIRSGLPFAYVLSGEELSFQLRWRLCHLLTPFHRFWPWAGGQIQFRTWFSNN
jgi:hypothetical protein